MTLINHSLESLIKRGLVPITLDTFTTITHTHFRRVGIDHNICYENLRGVRIENGSWMVFVDTTKDYKPFIDHALLP